MSLASTNASGQASHRLTANHSSADPLLNFLQHEFQEAFSFLSSSSTKRHQVTPTIASTTDTALHDKAQLEFCLESFLTRPRICSNLFPPKVQEQKYARVELQERLVLVSANVKTSSSSLSSASALDLPVLVAGLEVLEYILTPHLTQPESEQESTRVFPRKLAPKERIIYIAKVDTSGYWPLPGGPQKDPLTGKPFKSPAQVLVQGYLKAVRSLAIGSGTNTTSSRAMDKISLFIFARAQPQYLFPHSAENPRKRILEDRGLVRWWKRMVETVYEQELAPLSSSPGGLTENATNLKGTATQATTRGWWHIPGMDSERHALNVIQSFPMSPFSRFKFQYGYPDRNSTELARSMIPQFPDDPKSRMLQSASCLGGFVDMVTFWELVSISEENGAGKITGFFRVLEEFSTEHQEEQRRRQIKLKASFLKLSTKRSHGSILGGSTGDYTKMINFLLELNFLTVEDAKVSTKLWREEVQTWVENCLKKARGKGVEKGDDKDREEEKNDDDDDSESEKNVKEEEEGRDVGVEETEGKGDPRDHSREVQDQQLNETDESCRSRLWIQRLTFEVEFPRTRDDHPNGLNTESVPGPSVASLSPSAAPIAVNVLGAGLIRRSAPSTNSSSTPAAGAVNVLSAGLIKRNQPSFTSTPVPATGAVNVLNASLIKRKTPATIAAAPTTTATPSSGAVVDDGDDYVARVADEQDSDSLLIAKSKDMTKKRKTDGIHQ